LTPDFGPFGRTREDRHRPIVGTHQMDYASLRAPRRTSEIPPPRLDVHRHTVESDVDRLAVEPSEGCLDRPGPGRQDLIDDARAPPRWARGAGVGGEQCPGPRDADQTSNTGLAIVESAAD
jgi:hypothetical protein